MIILVKFRPDIPILMVMWGRLTRYGPKIGVPVRSSWKRVNMMPLNFRPPNPQIIMVNPRRKHGLKHWAHNPCKYYIWRNVWEKVMSR
jgi:hypothetical protein